MLGNLNNQKGTVAVMAAFILPVMLGFSALVIDIGNLYLNRVQLSAAADAAVLAAAQELPKNPTQAQIVAANYARTNGQATDNATITISPDNRTISANISRRVSLFFAPIFNLSNSTVSAKATAQINIAASVPWIVPFVLPKTQAFDYTHQFTMRMYDAKNPYGQYEFDYMNVGIQNTSFQDYINYLKYGYQKSFSVDQNMQYLGPSSGGKDSVEAFSDRTSRDPNTDYTKAKIGDPRVMLIPLVDKMLSRNTAAGTPMKIIGFVGFFLETVHEGIIQRDGNYGVTFYAQGRFLQDLNVGSGDSTTNSIYDFGVRTIKLSE
jgi:Flp pilus assembly protein TadG